jgi:hypothetical protein
MKWTLLANFASHFLENDGIHCMTKVELADVDFFWLVLLMHQEWSRRGGIRQPGLEKPRCLDSITKVRESMCGLRSEQNFSRQNRERGCPS